MILDERGGLVDKASGAEEHITNNRMELTAVTEAIRSAISLSEHDDANNPGDFMLLSDDAHETERAERNSFSLYTDSQYVKNGITVWIHSWKKKGWKTSSKDPVKNREYWEALDILSRKIDIDWKWVKGHAGNEYNELCDSLVQKAISSVER